MEKQLILSVGREFGSGGHVIAEALAERFGLPLYDNNLLEHIIDKNNIIDEQLKRYDEKPISKLFSRTVRGYSSSLEENLAHMQFNFLKNEAAKGNSYVVVGRCSESILKDCNGFVSIFVLGDKEKKAERVMEIYKLSHDEAKHLMEKEDARRKSYHNYYSKGKWGDSRNYDFSINSSKLGIDRTIDIIENYVKARLELM